MSLQTEGTVLLLANTAQCKWGDHPAVELHTPGASLVLPLARKPHGCVVTGQCWGLAAACAVRLGWEQCWMSVDGQQELEPEAHIVCVLLILNCLNWGLPPQGFSGKLMIHRFLGKTKKGAVLCLG